MYILKKKSLLLYHTIFSVFYMFDVTCGCCYLSSILYIFVLFRMNENPCFIKVLKNKKDVRDERIVMLLEYCLYYIV